MLVFSYCFGCSRSFPEEFKSVLQTLYSFGQTGAGFPGKAGGGCLASSPPPCRVVERQKVEELFTKTHKNPIVESIQQLDSSQLP